MAKEHLEERAGKRNVDNRLQVYSWRKMDWRRQNKTELDGEKWFMAYVSLGETRHKSSDPSHLPCKQLQLPTSHRK